MENFVEAMADYIQPFIKMGDGSDEDLEKALAFGQMCWTLAIAPKDKLDEMFDKIQELLEMDDMQFAGFKEEIILPMVQRHYDMFPKMHGVEVPGGFDEAYPPEIETPGASEGNKYPGTAPNALCPCNSGKKYKRCCGRMA